MPFYVDPKTFHEACRLYVDPLPGMIPYPEYREREKQAQLQQVIETEVTYVTCKLCGSQNVVKDGVRGAIQYYWCKDCKRKFSGTKALPYMRVPPDQIGTALNLFYEGLSLSESGRSVAQIYNVSPPADSTIYEWVSRFTQQAVANAADYRAWTGPLWAADETVLDVGGGRTKVGSDNTIWFWDVIDEETKFLLASHMSERRTIADARALFSQAAALVDSPPRAIVTDRLAAYLDGIEQVFGADTRHIQSQGMTTDSHNNIIERFHGTVKQRTKVMRGLKSRESAMLFMQGWLIHYNFFRPHESLNGRTPGEAARANYPYKEWGDVVRKGYHPQFVRGPMVQLP